MGKKLNFEQNIIMKKLSVLISIFFLCFSTAKAEIVKQITIEGNKRISDETVKIYGEIENNKNYTDEDIDIVLKNLYSTDFFEDVQISLENNILIINLKEYPIINQLIVVGEKNKRYLDQIKKIISTKERRSFIKSNLSKDIEIIKKLYSSLGYNSPKIETKLRELDENNLDLLIEIERGNQTKISSIKFIGNDSIRSKRLKDVIVSEEDKFYKIISKNTNFNESLVELDKRLLSNYYKSVGFYDVKITSNFAEINLEGNAELVYSIDEGNRFTINKISTNVDPVFDKSLFLPLNQIYLKYVGEYYSPFKIKELLEELDELIDKNNLQFVEHNVEEIVQENSINIVFNVFEGEKVLVERINIKGNNITNEDVIRGELILDEGDPFTNLNLEKSIAEIKARNIFKEVNYEINEGSKSNLKIINIVVEEKPTGEISAGAGVGTSGGNFAIGIRENNWLGEGKRVGFDLEIDEESLAGQLSYSNPNYDFLGNSLNYSLASEKNDKPDQGYENTLVSTGIKTGFEQYKNIFTNLGLTASYDDLRTLSTASSSLKKQSGEFSELAGTYGFRYDTRNRAFMPTSGSIIGFDQTLPIYADKKFIANTFRVSKYKSFSEDLVGATKFYLSSINGLDNEDVRLSKRVKLSSKRLRGFEKNRVGPMDGSDHIGGNYAAALNFEANLPKLLPDNTNTDIGLFLDFGNVWGVDYDSGIDKSNKIRSSTGIAASWLSPLGPMTFIFSTNLSKASTDKTESFNFNLGTTF